MFNMQLFITNTWCVRRATPNHPEASKKTKRAQREHTRPTETHHTNNGKNQQAAHPTSP